MKQTWEIKKLGEVCDKASSNVSQNKLENDNGDYPIFGASGFIKNVSFYHQDKPYLSIVKDGSGVGRVTRMDAFTSVIGTLQYILPKEDIDLDYLNYSLMSVDFKKYVAGAAIPHIYFKDYQNEPFLWVSLPEQQRIVAYLDDTFAKLNQAKANIFQNLQNAKQLFESELNRIFTEKGKMSESGFSELKDEQDLKNKSNLNKSSKSSNQVNPDADNEGDGWEEKKLGEVCEFLNGFAFKSSDVVQTSNTQLIRMGNLYQNKLNLERNPVFYPDTFAKDYNKYILKENDLIISLTGTVDKEDYGYTIKIPKTERNLLLNQRISKIIIKNELKLSKAFVLNFFLSRFFLDILYKTANGTRQANLSTETIKKLSINIPPLQTQQAIVSKLDALSAHTKQLENLYQQKLNNIEELKKSILAGAFAAPVIEE